MNDPIKIIEDQDGLTREELAAVKKIARYYGAGEIVLSVLIGFGAAALALVHVFDFIHATFNK